jgi:deoxyribodipyrimidine photolyase-related protein
MPRPKTLRLILGDQLNHLHHWFKKPDDQVSYVMMEIRQETDYATHHIQKVAAFFAAMRAFGDYLRNYGHQLVYLRLDDSQNQQTISANIKQLLRTGQFTRFEYLLPDEYRLDRQLTELIRELPVSCRAVDSEHFLSERNELSDFFANKKRFLLESFYRWMRKRYNMLMDGPKPAGGKWNYDKQNRHALNPKLHIPPALTFSNDVSHIVKILRNQGVVTIGRIEPNHLIWPISRAQALDLLHYFIEHLLVSFGTYQDAMTGSDPYLFHSRLSFALNSKLLHPLEVIECAVDAWQNNPNKIAIQQIEGFVRQILGWREYMRGIYWKLMPELAAMNQLGHNAKLPDFYWTGETSMNCLCAAIGQSLKHAYAHHIQRLMITGNFALLAGTHPDSVDEWYLGIYLDAIEWVELPNTRAMSQFADGGLVATKPYISSARYINNMSDYCQNCSYDWKQRHGERACPFNSLYWHFYHRHHKRLSKNPRVGVMYRTWERLDQEEKEQTLAQAATYMNNIDSL